jgi:hypothetical protein
MKSIVLIFVSILLFSSCKDKKAVEPTRTPEQLLTLNSWKLDRYTDASGKAISNSSLNVSALALFGLNFEFKENKETRAVDRITKNILNRGTWELIDANTNMNINITGFKGIFKVVSLTKGKLTLQASTGTFLSGVGASINMEFLETL